MGDRNTGERPNINITKNLTDI